MDLYVDSIDQLLQARFKIDKELRRHKTRVTVFFTDVVGSTTYFDRFGDTAGLLLLHRHDNLVTNAVAEFRGTVVKTIGDSVMAEFPEPVFAVRAAVQIQRRLFEQNQDIAETDRFRIRAGINCGVGFRRGNDLFGEAINVAARITKRSGPGQILISQSVREAIAGSEITSESLGNVTLEGKAEAEELHEVIWTEPTLYQDLRENIGASADPRLISQSDHLDEFIQRTLTPIGTGSTSSSSTPIPVPMPVPELQRYQILNRVGLGGMGIVFKARDRETGEIVALKVLKPEIARRPAVIEAFKNELRLARRITHRNVCRIYDFNRTDGFAFISMEFVEGESLRCILDRFSALSVRTGIKIATQILEGLREAHTQDIVHRDLKPENLMIDTSGNVKLMDFGLAHVVAEGPTVALGTPSYMAPEQAQGGQIDRRSDIYALGLVLFEMFTGSAAFTGDTPIAVALKQIQQAPTSPREIDRTIPDYIEKIILRCLEKDPENRFQSVEEVQLAMNSHPGGRITPTLKKQTGWAVLGVVVMAAAFVLAAVWTSGHTPAPETEVSQGATDAEFAAFHMAESLNTVEAWEAFIKDHPKGKLNSAANTRVEKLRVRATTAGTDSDSKRPTTSSSSIAPSNVPSPQAVTSLLPVTPAAVAKPVDSKAHPKLSTFIETVRLPGGNFMMGNDASKGDEKPRHQVKLDAFRMSKAEITNRQYFAFLEETGHARPKDPGFAKNYLMSYSGLPVVNVSYADAVEFCTWASRKFGVTVRLPTEAEWEYAARGRTVDSVYPRGANSPRGRAKYKDNSAGSERVVPEGTFAPNDFGLSNMSGNVWVWVLDFYAKDYYSVSPVRNPHGPETGTKRVVRGGSWTDHETRLTNSRRASRDPKEHSDQTGFRIVVEDRPPL